MTKNIIVLVTILVIVSCGYKSKDKSSNTKLNNHSELKPNDPSQSSDKNLDTDGDMILDKDELIKGNSKYIANFPKLKTSFLQNYKISVEYESVDLGKKGGQFLIDTSVRFNDPNFKYRIGEILLKEKAYQNAANVARFSSHSWGFYNLEDLTRIKYPDIDTRFYAKSVLTNIKYFNKDIYKIKNIKIDLENSIKLLKRSGFSEIKNLSLNFYYYNYKSESYEIIATPTIKRTFKAGVNETFKVEIQNINQRLITENYFKKGEFIISEVNNFDIPELKTTYKKLMSSIRAKSIPVVYNTPLEVEYNYVGINGKKESFIKILEKVYGKKFKIEDNRLVKVNQFENNLSDYTNLLEVRNEIKKGKWFIFTNKLNQHYLDYQFGKDDVISLSYITGKELSNQVQEKIVAIREAMSSWNGVDEYPIGNISQNSKIEIQMMPVKIFGRELQSFDDVLRPAGCRGSNCVQFDYLCNLSIHQFPNIERNFSYQENIDRFLSFTTLVLNDHEYSIFKLIQEKKISYKIVNGSINLVIHDINKIEQLSNSRENVLLLKISTFKRTTFNGVKLVKQAGREAWICGKHLITYAGISKLPLSVQSVNFDFISRNTNWNVIQRGMDMTYQQSIILNTFSKVTNNFN